MAATSLQVDSFQSTLVVSDEHLDGVIEALGSFLCTMSPLLVLEAAAIGRTKVRLSRSRKRQRRRRTRESNPQRNQNGTRKNARHISNSFSMP